MDSIYNALENFESLNYKLNYVTRGCQDLGLKMILEEFSSRYESIHSYLEVHLEPDVEI